MSALTHKNVLVVGEDHPYLEKLSAAMTAAGARLHHVVCAEFTAKVIDDLKIQLILVNNLGTDAVCHDTLRTISSYFTEKAIPVFVLIDEDSDRIQATLSLGVADYLTPQEEIESALAKMKAVFGQDELFSGSTDIDITPAEVAVSATGIRVFIVEDDPLLRNLLSLKLDKSKFPYEFSKDGINVLPTMKQFKPDVIVLDLMLPGRSGFEVLTEIKADQNLQSIPVIIFSNKDTPEDKQRAQELGARGFYVKAMTDLSELVEMIESLVK